MHDKDLDLRAEIGRSLCRACAASASEDSAQLQELVRAALESATDELGGLPRIGECPRTGKPDPNCPVARPTRR